MTHSPTRVSTQSSTAAVPPDIPQNTAYRLAYEAGMFLTSDEMTLAQNYFVNWLQLQNQLLYTPGVLSGLVVSLSSANNLTVSPGAGVDSAGHFVVLTEGAGNVITVPTSAANPCYVGLCYPSTPVPVANQPYTVNMAGILNVADSVDHLPTGSVVLAKIAMTEQGGIASVTDARTPVSSRLPAQLEAPVTGMITTTVLPRHLNGVAVVQGGGLRKQGDRTSHIVAFPPQQPPLFEQTPHVLVTVRGTLPYATAVSDVSLDGFTLTLTAMMSPVADSIDDIYVNWFAHV